MATRILDLPCVSYPITIGNDEDWLDSWAYLDASGNPLSLAGLVLVSMMRPSAGDSYVPVVAAIGVTTVAGLPVNGAIVPGGVNGNVLALQIPRSTLLKVAPGSYLQEVQAIGDGLTKRIALNTVTVEQGLIR